MDEGFAAFGLDLAHNRLGLGAITARIDQNRGTAVRQRQRDRAADVAACTGDDGHLAAEFVAIGHVQPFSRHRPRKRTIQ
jgi:hypothetical protein